MIPRIIIIVVVPCLLVNNIYAGTAKKMENVDGKVIVDISSNGKRIELKVGEEMQIELEGGGSTGYWWYFDRLDNTLFELIGEDTRAIGGGEEKAAGRPVIGIWKLRAKEPGRSIIKMKYYRTWEKSDKAINQFEISVDISP